MSDDGYYHKYDDDKPALVVTAKCGKRVTKFRKNWNDVTCPACKKKRFKIVR